MVHGVATTTLLPRARTKTASIPLFLSALGRFRSKKVRKPAYALHRPTGQARVRIGGKDHYLGAYGSPESRERYDDLLSEWLARGDAERYRLTLDDLSLLYLEHARSHCRKNGEATSEFHAFASRSGT